MVATQKLIIEDKKLLAIQKQLNDELEGRNRSFRVTHLKERIEAQKELIKLGEKEVRSIRDAKIEKNDQNEKDKEAARKAKERAEAQASLAEERAKIEGQINAILKDAARQHDEVGKTADQVEIIRTQSKYDQLIDKAKKHSDLIAKLKSARDVAVSDIQAQQELDAEARKNEKLLQEKTKALELEKQIDFEVSLLAKTADEMEIARIEEKYRKKEELLGGFSNREKELALLKEAEITAIEKEASERRQRQAQVENELKLQATSQGLRGVAQLFAQAASQDKKARLAYKTAAISDALISTYLAANKALAAFPPPFNFIAAAGVTAAGIANVSSIRAQKMQDGGIAGFVPGTNFQGDMVDAKLNSGELVLNRRQQGELYAIAKGRSSSKSQAQSNTFSMGDTNIVVQNGMSPTQVTDLFNEALNNRNLDLAEMLRQNAEFGVSA